MSPPVAPPTDLVAALRAGDVTAFDAAYDRYRASLYSFLVRMTGQRTLSEDLLQDTFVRLARHAKRLRPDTNLRAWLFAVARNQCRSHYRWAALDARRTGELHRASQPGPDGAVRTPFEELAGNQMELAVERALAELAPPLREALLLVAVERLTPSEAAAVAGVSADALRQRLRRARKCVASALGRDNQYREQS